MPKLTVVTGLPGSGKSHNAQAIARERGIAWFTEFYHQKKRLTEEGLVGLVAHLEAGGDAVADDVHFCAESFREVLSDKIGAARGEVEIEWVVMEPDVEKCQANIAGDWFYEERPNTDGRIQAFEIFRKSFSVPAGAQVLPVHVCYKLERLAEDQLPDRE
jgi:hypothetical protein